VRLLRRSAIVFLCAWTSGVCAQSASVERAAKGPSGKPIQVGLYLNIRPDCTAGPLPTIRLAAPPERGKVVVKKAKVSATNFKQCLAFEVPGLVAFYQSQPNFVGLDRPQTCRPPDRGTRGHRRAGNGRRDRYGRGETAGVLLTAPVQRVFPAARASTYPGLAPDQPVFCR